jgi:hypothetical protein
MPVPWCGKSDKMSDRMPYLKSGCDGTPRSVRTTPSNLLELLPDKAGISAEYLETFRFEDVSAQRNDAPDQSPRKSGILHHYGCCYYGLGEA